MSDETTVAGPLPERARPEEWRGETVFPWEKETQVVAVSKHPGAGLTSWRWLPVERRWASFAGSESAEIFLAWALVLRTRAEAAERAIGEARRYVTAADRYLTPPVNMAGAAREHLARALKLLGAPS
jgi:hypothetical protein